VGIPCDAAHPKKDIELTGSLGGVRRGAQNRLHVRCRLNTSPYCPSRRLLAVCKYRVHELLFRGSHDILFTKHTEHGVPRARSLLFDREYLFHVIEKGARLRLRRINDIESWDSSMPCTRTEHLCVRVMHDLSDSMFFNAVAVVSGTLALGAFMSTHRKRRKRYRRHSVSTIGQLSSAFVA
jgi:hypothetical protein